MRIPVAQLFQDMVVPREFLPIPFPLADGTRTRLPYCRTVRRRSLQKMRWQEWCNQGVQAISELYGMGPF